MRRLLTLFVLAIAFGLTGSPGGKSGPFGTPQALAYPIDGYAYTGIRRLDFYDLAQKGEVDGRQLPPGGRLPNG